MTVVIRSRLGHSVPKGPAGPGAGGGGGRVTEREFDAPPVAKSDTEKKIFATLEEMKQGPRYANVSATDGRLLRILTESVQRQERGRDRHIDRRVRGLVRTGPARDRRTSFHSRNRRGACQDRPGEFPEGRRRRLDHHHPWATPTRPSNSTRTRSTCCSWTPTRKATSTISTNCCPWCGPAA